MGEPFSYQTVRRVAEAMRAIRMGDGYYTDVGATVDLEQVLADEDQQFPGLPRVSVMEESWTPSASKETAAISEQVIVIQGIVLASGAGAERDAHRLRADIVRAAMAITRETFRGTTYGDVKNVQITGPRDLVRRPEGMNVLGAQVAITLTCVERATA